MRAQQIFQSLEGKWIFQRCLDEQATMEGLAQFTKLNRPAAYYYQEEGEVRHQKQYWHAYKDYVYVLQHHAIAVHFWDAIQKQPGQLLHTLELPSNQHHYPASAHHMHVCQADHYQAHYQFDHPTAFQLTYTIHGPRKCWVIKTNFYKILAQ